MNTRNAPPALRWSAYLSVALLFAVGCGFLSQWQFARNEERARELALVEMNYDRTPVPLDDVLPRGGELPASEEWTPVRLTGSYLPDQQLLVRNRPHGGTSAFEVLVPFRTEDGRVLLIDRGWVPPGDDRHAPDAVPGPPTGEVTVVARMRHGESGSASAEVSGNQIPTIDLPLAADLLHPGATVETGAYAVMASESPAPAQVPNALAAPTEDPGPHLSYAVQWILFAVMGFAFLAYAIVTERRARREDAEDAPVRAKTTRRRDRDADEEDALLDSAGR